jgi:hypothetical protein
MSAINRTIRRDVEWLLAEAGVVIHKAWDDVTREWTWWAERPGCEWYGDETQYSYAAAVSFALWCVLAQAGVIDDGGGAFAA